MGYANVMPYANPADKAAWKKAQRAKRRQAGVCDRCGKEPMAAMGYVWCAPCVIKHRTECCYSRQRRIEMAEDYSSSMKYAGQTGGICRFALIAGQQRSLYEDRKTTVWNRAERATVRRLYFAPQCVPVTVGYQICLIPAGQSQRSLYEDRNVVNRGYAAEYGHLSAATLLCAECVPVTQWGTPAGECPC